MRRTLSLYPAAILVRSRLILAAVPLCTSACSTTGDNEPKTLPSETSVSPPGAGVGPIASGGTSAVIPDQSSGAPTDATSVPPTGVQPTAGSPVGAQPIGSEPIGSAPVGSAPASQPTAGESSVPPGILVSPSSDPSTSDVPPTQASSTPDDGPESQPSGNATVNPATVDPAPVQTMEPPDAPEPSPGTGGDGFYRMEALDRGIVAVPVNGGMYVGWRMFGYEYEPGNGNALSFNVYRDGQLAGNVTDSTNFVDAAGTPNSRYSVAALFGETEQKQSPAVAAWQDNYLRIPLEPPGPNHANDGSAADLDGDGQYEIIVKWEADNSKDNSQAGVTSDVFLDALKLDGTRLWRINLGPNIRAGAHYTQFIVMDLDGDGRAEMGVKTAPGTRDATGSYLSLGPAANDNDTAIYRNGDGYVLDGPEYFTIFDGASGVELATENFKIGRGNVGDWGDTYGNRVDRFLATGAWLDDSGLPSVVMARGYYTRTTLTAWNFRGGELTELWTFDSDQVNGAYSGQGNHSLSVANVDQDAGQEIIYGAMVVDHDGSAKCSTNMLHGDALHVSDFLPDRPGIEVFGPTENKGKPKWYVYDGGTCELVSQGPVSDDDVGRGVAADVSASNPGAELWASSGVSLTAVSNGSALGGNPPSVNFLAWWNADELRELEDGTSVSTYDGRTLLQCQQCASNNGTKSTPTLVADLLGDWREEIIWRESDSSALRLYTTTDLTARRIYTLMHDPQYRAAISWQNVAYNQPPHPGFFIGADMPEPPIPDIRVE